MMTPAVLVGPAARVDPVAQAVPEVRAGAEAASAVAREVAALADAAAAAAVTVAPAAVALTTSAIPKLALNPGAAPLTFRWWRMLGIPVLLACLALALSLPRLSTPPVYVFDELYYAYTAGRMVAGVESYDTSTLPQDDPAIEWTHPPLAKLLIAGGILAAGDSPFGWRIVSVLFGVIGVLLTYALALTLTGHVAASSLAAALLLLDPLYLVESRVGMSNLFLVVFSLAALLAFARAWSAPAPRIRLPMLATGLCLGLALATKWSAVALLGLVTLAVCWRSLVLWRQGRESSADFRLWNRWAAVSILGLPILVYLASYLHFFLTGHDWTAFVSLHQTMLGYHRNLGTVHSDSSPWWQWPLDIKPVWYYLAERRREVAAVLGIGNPMLYWPMVLAVVWVGIEWWGRRSAALLIVAIGFFGQWLPWALSPRGTFIYHFLPAVPLGCLALAIVISNAWREGGWHGWRRGAVGIYLLAVIATFAIFYPLATALPLAPEQGELRLWLASWR